MSAVDGLVSGMNTSDIIAPAHAARARSPSRAWRRKKSTADKAITALQGLNTKFLAHCATSAKKLSTRPPGWSRR